MVAIDAQHQTVTFTYRDYRHGSQRKQLTLSALEFIRRFSLHILSSGLVRIRHYGILANNTVQPEKPSSIGRRPGAATYCANHLLLLITAQLGGSSNPRAAEVLQSGASLKRR
jgi:Putative transposase